MDNMCPVTAILDSTEYLHHQEASLMQVLGGASFEFHLLKEEEQEQGKEKLLSFSGISRYFLISEK